MGGAHVEGLYHLGKGQDHKGQRLSTGDRTCGVLTDPVGRQGQKAEHHALQDDTNAESMGKQSFIPGAGGLIHDVLLHRFHTQRDSGQ